MDVKYECIKCGHGVSGSPVKYDGRHCEKCDGPLDVVKLRRSEGMDVKRIDYGQVQIKLSYLHELKLLWEAQGCADKSPFPERIIKLCDSIEMDLNLRSTCVGDLTVKLTLDTSDFVEAFGRLSKETVIHREP